MTAHGTLFIGSHNVKVICKSRLNGKDKRLVGLDFTDERRNGNSRAQTILSRGYAVKGNRERTRAASGNEVGSRGFC